MTKKKYILITGATSSLGETAAVSLSNNFNLILAGRNKALLADTLRKCANNENHLIWIFNLQNIDELETNLSEFIKTNDIFIDIFIHCAGVLKMVPLRNVSKSNLLEIMNVNFNSAALIIKTLINNKINSSALKNVVLISSIASIRGVKAFNIYSASKGALDALMRSLAVELAPKVRINSILPGSIKTKMTAGIFDNEELVKKMEKDYPLGIGEPEDISELVCFLISDKAKWITGQQFVVDGGRSINITA